MCCCGGTPLQKAQAVPWTCKFWAGFKAPGCSVLCGTLCWWQRMRGEVLCSPLGAFCQGVNLMPTEGAMCQSSAWFPPWTMTPISLVLWFEKLNLANFHSFYLFSSRMLFLPQRWWILLLWYNLASPERCYILEKCPSPLMLVIWPTGRSEYELHLRIQLVRFYL